MLCELREPLSSMPDSELLITLPALLTRERAVLVEVIGYLIEIDRRRLYLEQACSSLRSFCVERLGYSEDEASKRVRVVRLARRLPRVLDELQNGGIHLTGLFLLAPYLNEENAEALLSEARGVSRQQIEHLLARRFPRPEQPHALNGPSTVENLSLLCAAHNAQSARKVFGEQHIEKKRRERAESAQTEAKVCSALCRLGFRKQEVLGALAKLGTRQAEDLAPEPLLRACLASLVP